VRDHRFGLGIFDEAHKTASDTAGLFATALHDANIRIDKRLFLTATPRVRSLRKGRDGDSVAALSMDDECIYGRCVFGCILIF
jgi:predicted helicase